MCGIIGYTGTDNAVPKIFQGLSVLEYRGYDSVGIAAETADGVRVLKCKGRIGDLERKEEKHPLVGVTTAIGHTRWATHGGPFDHNAHPHRAGKVTLVHNGIIENYKDLKEQLLASGVTFLSETDTEVAAAVLDRAFAAEGEPVAAIRRAVKELVGSYAFGILFDGFPEEIFAVRQGSPLILAKGADGYYLASDMTALLPFTKEYCCLEEGQIARLSKKEATLFLPGGEAMLPAWRVTDMTAESAQKEGYAHFMEKEIHEQPEMIVKSVKTRIKNGLPSFLADDVDDEFLGAVRAVQIVGCGSAYHAGLVGARWLEEVAKVPTTVHIASEYRYYPPLAGEGTLVVLLSQSGETADTLAALRYAKAQHLPTLAIVNAVETSIAREADRRVYTYAGPEIAVATTKGYCTQVSVLFTLAMAIGLVKGHIPAAKAEEEMRALTCDAPRAVEMMLQNLEQFRRISAKIYQKEHAFYIGRGLDYALSLEGALKLKEISYIHCEAYAAGELKHGTISLVEEDTPVIAVSTDRALWEKTESNIREVRSRGAYVILICREDTPNADSSADEVIRLPAASDAGLLFGALAAVQEISYETAKRRECDIDRPRNLAKSVTVD